MAEVCPLPWFHHFAHLFVRTFVCTYTFLGTSPGGMAAQIVTLLATEAQGGWWKLSTWRTNWRGALKRGFYTLVTVWAITFAICGVTTIYDDHRAFSNRLRALVNENNRLKSESQNTTSPANNSGESRNIQLKREIQSKLSLFMTRGEAIRDAWKAAMGKPGESQLPHANKARQWHTELEDYLRKIPKGDIYIARLNSAPRTGFGGYPMGHDPKVNDTWDLLISDLAVLDQFIKDPELGRP